jgi:hypothetical protein
MHIIAVTRNKSIAVTTLHSLMTTVLYAGQKNESTEVHFVENLSSLAKFIKTGERILWFDYGTNLDHETIMRLFSPMEKDIRVIVFPAVLEGVDWEMFRKKAGSAEPIHQRALNFDTEVNPKKITGTDLHDVISSSARVWIMDPKFIDRKLKSVQKNLSCETYEGLFHQLKSLNIRIAALPSATVIRHYTYKCLGSILEVPGILSKP